MNDDNASVPSDPVELVQELRRFRERIPNYGQLTVQQAQSMTRVANLPPEFVNAGLVAAKGYDKTETLTGMTGEELWQLREADGPWTMLEDELVVLLRGVHAANLKRRHTIGQAVLQLYTVLRSLIKQKEHSYLIPFVAMMKEANHIRGKGKQKAVAEEEQSPSPNEGKDS
ncbi:MAG TPA: hypothetical protein VNN08_02480 [Thermoanaerobaculia bacterium]|nr:hypothetical protein [Thermoanaerobaculia bacterium]